MGKPPREKLRPSPPQMSESNGKPEGRASVKDKSGDQKLDTSNDGGCADSGSIVLDSGSFLGFTDDPSTWDPMNDNANNLAMDFEGFDPLSALAFNPSDFDGLVGGDYSFDNSLSSNLLAGPNTQTEALMTNPAAHNPQIDEFSIQDSAPLTLDGIKNHDCPCEAYEILGSLSFLNLREGHPVPILGATSTSSATEIGTGSSTNEVALDRVLRLNREASERLGGLLNCSCARSLNLALLYASNISRVLYWYHQAAACTQDPAAMRPKTTEPASHYPSPNLSPPDLNPGGGAGSSSTWARAPAAGTLGTGAAAATAAAQTSPSSTQSSGPVVASAKMAIGSFNVDDLRVQTALKIQLILGEMGRVGRLIDQFIASHNAGGQYLADTATFGSVGSLYQCLDSWLKGEHSRITSMMKSRLWELNS